MLMRRRKNQELINGQDCSLLTRIELIELRSENQRLLNLVDQLKEELGYKDPIGEDPPF